MQEDEVFVRKNKFDLAQRIRGSWPLYEFIRETPGADGFPIDGLGIDDRTIIITDINVLGLQITRVPFRPRHYVLRKDTGWNRPGWIEYHVLQRGFEHRRLAIRFADLGARRPNVLSIANQEHAELRNIHKDEFIFDIIEHPPGALQVYPDLFDTSLHRHVERRQSAGTHHAIRR